MFVHSIRMQQPHTESFYDDGHVWYPLWFKLGGVDYYQWKYDLTCYKYVNSVLNDLIVKSIMPLYMTQQFYSNFIVKCRHLYSNDYW